MRTAAERWNLEMQKCRKLARRKDEGNGGRGRITLLHGYLLTAGSTSRPNDRLAPTSSFSMTLFFQRGNPRSLQVHKWILFHIFKNGLGLAV